MSLPLCSSPVELKCTQNIISRILVKYEECLPKCSGVWLTKFDGNKINNNNEPKIQELSKQYWNYKGFYKFPKKLSDDKPNPFYGEGKDYFKDIMHELMLI